MSDLKFWLHMDADYQWIWLLSAEDGNTVCCSAQTFFDRVEAERALSSVREHLLPS